VPARPDDGKLARAARHGNGAFLHAKLDARLGSQDGEDGPHDREAMVARLDDETLSGRLR
jgi:hypothetical protein